MVSFSRYCGLAASLLMISVVCIESMTLKSGSEEQEGVLGSKGIILCEVSGVTDPVSFGWRSPKGRLTSNGDKFEQLGNMLIIKELSRTDGGIYTCNARIKSQRVSKLFDIHFTVVEPGPRKPALRVVERHPTWIKIDIETPAAAVEHLRRPPIYIITGRILGDNATFRSTIGYKEQVTTATIRGLRPATSYVFNVRTFVRFKQSPISDPLITSTIEAPKPPTKLVIRTHPHPDTFDSFNLEWDKPQDNGSPITGYILRYIKIKMGNDDPSQWRIDSDVDKEPHRVDIRGDTGINNYVLRNLTRGSFYELSIIAENAQGNSEPARMVIKTGGGVSFFSISPNTVKVLSRNDTVMTCKEDGPPYSAKSIRSLALKKQGQSVDSDSPFAVINALFNFVIAPGLKSNTQVEGSIESAPGQSFLRFTITDPKLEDAGLYICQVTYSDGTNELMTEESSDTLTVDPSMETDTWMNLLHKLSDLETNAEIQGKQLKEQKKHVENLENQIAQQALHTQGLAEKLNEIESESFSKAFSVGFDGAKRFSPGDTVLISDTVTNVGNAFDGTKGVFTAPSDGLYMFHLVVTYGDGTGNVGIDLQANGKRMESLGNWHRDNPHESSVGAVIALKAGDEVKAVVMETLTPSAASDLVLERSVFTGYQLEGSG